MPHAGVAASNPVVTVSLTAEILRQFSQEVESTRERFMTTMTTDTFATWQSKEAGNKEPSPMYVMPNAGLSSQPIGGSLGALPERGSIGSSRQSGMMQQDPLPGFYSAEGNVTSEAQRPSLQTASRRSSNHSSMPATEDSYMYMYQGHHCSTTSIPSTESSLLYSRLNENMTYFTNHSTRCSLLSDAESARNSVVFSGVGGHISVGGTAPADYMQQAFQSSQMQQDPGSPSAAQRGSLLAAQRSSLGAPQCPPIPEADRPYLSSGLTEFDGASGASAEAEEVEVPAAALLPPAQTARPLRQGFHPPARSPGVGLVAGNAAVGTASSSNRGSIAAMAPVAPGPLPPGPVAAARQWTSPAGAGGEEVAAASVGTSMAGSKAAGLALAPGVLAAPVAAGPAQGPLAPGRVAGTGRPAAVVAAPPEVAAAAPAPGQAGEQPRTTLMIQSLPRSYTRDMLVQLLNQEGFQMDYDFIYLPIKFVTNASFGYAFVNFTTVEAANRCSAHFEGFSAWGIEDDSVCTVSGDTTHHGQEAHVQLYRNSPVMHESVPDNGKPAVYHHGERVPFPSPTKNIRPPRPLFRQNRP